MRRHVLLPVVVLFLISCHAETGVESPQKLKPDTLLPISPPVADFTATPIRGAIPLIVVFSDQSKGSITQWSWDFGDGQFSGEQQPTHMYNSVGKFTVSLTVFGPGGKDSKTKVGYIEVIPETISWEEASKYIGQTKVVEGTVVDTKYAPTSKGQPTFLNIGKPYPQPGRFTAIIWGSDRRKFIVEFPPDPETYFLKKRVQVSGLIEEYKGSAEIILRDPSQIKVIE